MKTSICSTNWERCGLWVEATGLALLALSAWLFLTYGQPTWAMDQMKYDLKFYVLLNQQIDSNREKPLVTDKQWKAYLEPIDRNVENFHQDEENIEHSRDILFVLGSILLVIGKLLPPLKKSESTIRHQPLVGCLNRERPTRIIVLIGVKQINCCCGRSRSKPVSAPAHKPHSA